MFGAPWLPAVPVKVGVVTLLVLPLVGAVIVTVGATWSIRNVLSLLVPTLPAASVCVASTV